MTEDLRSRLRSAVDAHLPDRVDTEALLRGAESRARRRVVSSWRVAAAAAVFVVLLAGTWLLSPGGGRIVPSLHGAGGIVEVTCPAGADCARTYLFDGKRYQGPTCAGVREEAVSGEVIARGDIDGRATEVRRINSVSVSLAVAVRVATQGCSETPTGELSAWSFAFASNDAALDAVYLRDLHHAVCLVIATADRSRNRCGPQDVAGQSAVDVAAPIAPYDTADWNWSLPVAELECERGTVGFRAEAADPSDTDSTSQAALNRLAAEVLSVLSAGEAAATSTVAFRQTRGSGSTYEELFFRGDVWPVAYGKVTRTTGGRWIREPWLGCVPAAAVPAGADPR